DCNWRIYTPDGASYDGTTIEGRAEAQWRSRRVRLKTEETPSAEGSGSSKSRIRVPPALSLPIRAFGQVTADDERRAYQTLLAHSSNSVGVHDLIAPDCPTT